MNDIDEVKQRVDIVELIGRYVMLKRAGATYKGLCPFHNERTPSFAVFPQNGTWRCFGACGISGDVFSFVMRRENLDFREALQMLANEVGVQLDDGIDDPQKQHRTRLYEINELAANYFQEILRHHAGAQAARDYLQQRGIDGETAARFRLGFALEGWSGLRDYLSEKGFTMEDQFAAGLVKQHEERRTIYDAFRSRVMIPIRDRQTRVIGFGGRVLDKTQPKYLNTSETAIFRKSQVVYGLDLAREAIRTAKQVVIVEGYMDVIAAHQHGFANVVACMGTALTAEQLQQLHRFTNSFVLALDADTAGQQATIRGLNQARQALTRVRKPTVSSSGQVEMAERLGANLAIASMPEGRDPDDVIRQEPALWQKLVEQAEPLVDFYFRFATQQYNLQTAQGKGQAVAELAPLIAELADEIERQHYIQQLSRYVRVDEQTILSRVRAAMRTGQAAVESFKRRSSLPISPTVGRGEAAEGERAESKSREDAAPVSAPAARPAAEGKRIVTQEEHFLANLLREPNLLVWLTSAAERLELRPLGVDDLLDVQNQEIFKALKQYLSGDEQWDIEQLQEMLVSNLHGHLARLIEYSAKLPQASAPYLREDTIQTLIRMRIQQLGQEAKNIKFLQEDAIAQGDMMGAKQFGDLNNQYLRELFHLQQSRALLTQLLFRSSQTRQAAV